MPTFVTLHIYSGGSDPTWMLSTEDVKRFWSLLGALRVRTALKATGVGVSLGYRGFTVVEAFGASIREVRISEGVVDLGSARASLVDAERALEHHLLTTAIGVSPYGMAQIERSLSLKINDLLAARRERLFLTPEVAVCGPGISKDAPKYAPDRWNYDPIQGKNTCYNYANNQILQQEASPGNPPYSCSSLVQGATAQGLVRVTDRTVPLDKGQGWYVAVATCPHDPRDFHFLRQDEDGCWSHKLGHGEVSNLDENDHVITDPAQAKIGHYTVCAFMITNCKVTIS